MTMNEIWKDIKGHEGRYQISNKGRVKRLASSTGKRMFKEEIRKPTNLVNGFNPYVTLNTTRISVCRLVAEAFISNPKGCRFVKHKNGDTTDLCAKNLEWVSRNPSTRKNYTCGIVIKVDPISGETINEYDSIKHASEDNGISISQIISSCKGVAHKTGEFMYFFNNDRHKITERINKYKEKHERSIIQLDKSGSIVDVFNSISLASTKTGIGYRNIWNCCTGRVKSSKGSRFRFSDEQLDCINPDEV